MAGSERLTGCDLEGVESFEQLKERLETFAAEHPDRPLLRAYGLNYQDPPVLDPARVRFQLDEIVSDRPLMILAHDLHTLWVNTRALQESDFLVSRPPYPREIEELDAHDGIEIDADGMPTGELREPTCYYLVEGALGSKYPRTPQQKLEALKKTVAELNSLGITSVHQMGLAMPEADVELLLLLLELEETGELHVRVESSFSVVPDEFMLEDVHAASELRDALLAYRQGELGWVQFHAFLVERLQAFEEVRRYEAQRAEGTSAHGHIFDRHVRLHLERLKKRMDGGGPKTTPKERVSLEAVKVFLDGVIEKKTAYRTDEEPRPGIPNFSPQELKATVVAADEMGLQVRAHCIGDGAVGQMLDAVSEARRQNADRDKARGHRVRHRVEHIEMSRPEDLPRFAAHDVVPSMQPFHERPPERLWHKMVPESRWDTAFPWRALKELGTPPVFGSDWPIVSCDCLAAARHAARRTPWVEGQPDQGLSLTEALESFTLHPPRAVHREDRLGTIEPGKLADLVVLTPGELEKEAQIRMTVCGGRIVYQA